jgi:hypothetical protein
MKAICPLAIGLLTTACTESAPTDTQSQTDKNVQTAEAFIDAFYAFDPAALERLLASAPESAPAMLYYQGWAEGGNYKIVERRLCEAASSDVVRCAITVQDDPVLALDIDFHVTDTFTIGFEDGRIVSVENSSNDKQIYYDAFDWVTREMPEVMTGPCQGFFDGGPTPGDCARAMTEGYRRFAASDAYPRSQ